MSNVMAAPKKPTKPGAKAPAKRTPASKASKPASRKIAAGSTTRRPSTKAPTKRVVKGSPARRQKKATGFAFPVDPQHGNYITISGVTLQALGLAADTVMHFLDSSLALRENPVGLSNPAHIVVALGLVATVLGVAWTFAATGITTKSRMYVAGAVGLIVLAVVALGITVRSAPAATPEPAKPGHDMSSPKVVPAATKVPGASVAPVAPGASGLPRSAPPVAPTPLGTPTATPRR